MEDGLEQTDGLAGRHDAARRLAERAVAAQAAGDGDTADELFAEAERIDPEAVIAVLQEHASDPAGTSTGTDADPQDDAAIAAMSRTIEPGSGAPSRANITGPGSGADSQGG